MAPFQVAKELWLHGFVLFFSLPDWAISRENSSSLFPFRPLLCIKIYASVVTNDFTVIGDDFWVRTLAFFGGVAWMSCKGWKAWLFEVFLLTFEVCSLIASQVWQTRHERSFPCFYWTVRVGRRISRLVTHDIPAGTISWCMSRLVNYKIMKRHVRAVTIARGGPWPLSSFFQDFLFAFLVFTSLFFTCYFGSPKDGLTRNSPLLSSSWGLLTKRKAKHGGEKLDGALRNEWTYPLGLFSKWYKLIKRPAGREVSRDQIGN